VAYGKSLVSVEKVIADIGSRRVDIRSQAQQHAVAIDVIPADVLLVGFDFRQEGDCAEPEDAEQNEEPAESRKQRDPGLTVRRPVA
jgi:hypothetical protein